MCKIFLERTRSLEESLTDLQINLTVKNIITGIPTKECPLLNYLIILGKLHLCECRGRKELPNIQGFRKKVKLKYETEKYTSAKKKLEYFDKKWKINFI